MTRDEAIDKIRWDLMGRAFVDPQLKQAYETILPELKENWHEQVRKQLIETVRHAAGDGGIHISEELERRYMKYLESVKELELKESDVDLLAGIISDVRKYRDEWGDFNTSEAFAKEVIRRFYLKRII